MYASALMIAIGAMLVGDILLVILLATVVTTQITDWLNPANVYLDTCETPSQRKKSVKSYMKTIESNIEKTITTLRGITGMETLLDFNGFLKTLTTDYLQKTEIDINKKLDASNLFYIKLNIKNTIAEFSNLLCAELNKIFFEKDIKIRFMYNLSPDENTGTLEIVVINKATERTDKRDVYVIMDNRLNILYHLVPFDDSFDTHIMYYMSFPPSCNDGAIIVRSDVVDGSTKTYTKIPFDSSLTSMNGYNPDTAFIIDSINEYFGPQENEDGEQKNDENQDQEADQDQDDQEEENDQDTPEDAGDNESKDDDLTKPTHVERFETQLNRKITPNNVASKVSVSNDNGHLVWKIATVKTTPLKTTPVKTTTIRVTPTITKMRGLRVAPKRAPKHDTVTKRN